jgi:hypothetical protein
MNSVHGWFSDNKGWIEFIVAAVVLWLLKLQRPPTLCARRLAVATMSLRRSQTSAKIGQKNFSIHNFVNQHRRDMPV